MPRTNGVDSDLALEPLCIFQRQEIDSWSMEPDLALFGATKLNEPIVERALIICLSRVCFDCSSSGMNVSIITATEATFVSMAMACCSLVWQTRRCNACISNESNDPPML